MQAEKETTAAAAHPAAGKPPSICDRLQRAFRARPAFRPLRRLTVRHQDGDGETAKPAGDGDGAAPVPRRCCPTPQAVLVAGTHNYGNMEVTKEPMYFP